jgi:drug/metabolite transporter (DMT)-like permease
MNKRLGLFQIHGAALLAGFTGLFGKWLDVSPVMITAGRTIFGSISLLIAIRLMGSNVRLNSRRELLTLIISGGLLTAHWLTFFKSIQVSTVAVGLLAFSSFPIFVTFLEPLVFKERFQYIDIITAAIVVTGLILVAPVLDVRNHITQGVLWGVLSGLAYALLSLLSRSSIRTVPAMTVAFYQQLFAALIALPFALLSREPITMKSFWLLLILGVIFTALAQSLLVASLRHIRAQMASVVISLEPVYGIVFARLFLHEVPTARTLLGGVLICGAVFAATLQHIKTRHKVSELKPSVASQD